MMKKTRILFSFIFTLFCLSAVAQKQTIKGWVNDHKGNALEGVTVKNSNTKAVANTNKNGSFTIIANSNDLITFIKDTFFNFNLQIMYSFNFRVIF